jgi:hypothetical protein
MKRFYWTGISHDERIKAISETTYIVDKYGIISTSNRFSDLSFNLMIEIEECKVNDLYINLKEILFMEDMESYLTDSRTDCVVFLSITFTKSTGDLKIEVPNVPG